MSTETDGATPADPGLEALVTLLRFQGVAADRGQIRHRLGTTRVAHRRCSAAPRTSGLKARAWRTKWSRLATHALARHRVTARWRLPGARQGRRGQGPGPVAADVPRPALMTRHEFEAVWDGGLVLMTRRAALVGSRPPLRHHLVPGRDPQIPPSAGRGAGRLVLPAAVRAGLAAVLPGRHRQGAGASQPEHARRAGHRPAGDRGLRDRARASCAPICSRTPPTASTSSWARGCSAICWRCRSPISRRGASAIRWRACASWRTSAISSPARR